jgi:outer membrane cobalamin receptor
VKDGSFENPLPRSWAGDCFFRCLLSLSASVSGAGVSFLNVGMAESSGVEAGFQVLLLWQLRLDGSYTFLETKVIQDGGIGGAAFPVGQPLLRRPKNQGSVGLTSLGDRWTVAFTVNVVGSAPDRDFSQQGSPRVTLPGYTTIGLSGSYAVFSNVWHMKSLR